MMRINLSLIVKLLLITISLGSKSPVVLVPGDGGSQIEAILHKPSVVNQFCYSNTDYWYHLWFTALEFLPIISIDCFVDNLRLVYDNETRTTSNSPGVQTRVVGWGDPTTVENLDPNDIIDAGEYLNDIVAALVDNLGYERGVSVRAAPYDFRKAPNENKNWFVDMKELVEETYRQNKNTPVTLIVHSMGGPMSLLFLQQQTRAWKRKYIARMISLSGAWGGSVKSIKVFAIGDNLDNFFIFPFKLRIALMSFPSTAWLLPSPLIWKNDEVLVETPSRNYTMAQLEEFFRDMDYSTGWEMRKDTIKYSLDFSPPDVEVHCLYGSNIPTVEKLHYASDNISTSIPDLIIGDGDGTINERSLKACKLWQAHQTPKVSSLEIPNNDHMSILHDYEVIRYILNVMSEKIDSEP